MHNPELIWHTGRSFDAHEHVAIEPALPLTDRLAAQQLDVVEEDLSLMLDDDLINAINDIHGNLGGALGYCTTFAHAYSCSPCSSIATIQTKREHA